MIFAPFKQQAEFLQSDARVRCLFSSKRCINPSSKVLTADGVKAFGDIVSGDALLSFDQKANRFAFRPSGPSFPKSRGPGYRIVHTHGEFVASESHRVLTASHGYLTLAQIHELHVQGAIEQPLTFVSPSQSIEDIYQSMLLSDDQSSLRRREDCLDDYEECSHRYDQPPHLLLEAGQSLSQPLCGVQEYAHHDAQEASLHLGALDHMGLEYSHLYQHYDHLCSEHALHHEAYRFGCGEEDLKHVDNVVQNLDLRHIDQQFLPPSDIHQNIFEASSQNLGSIVSACFSHMLLIEQVSNQEWWDVTVPGTHNYVSGGAVHHNSGKSEACYIDVILKAEKRPGWSPDSRDPYLICMILPTDQMLKKLAWPKFFQFAKPMGVDPYKDFNKTENRLMWPNGTVIYGISAEKIQRMEGLKVSHILMDEALQMKDQVFYESLARLSDSQGSLVISGSLGTNIINPKRHWVYETFKEKDFGDTEIWEWRSVDNPYFPKDELKRLEKTLDPRTYRALFEIDWNVAGTNLVYDDFDDQNITNCEYNPNFETYAAIDWGWTHPMACLFIQYDRRNDTVYIIDEIYGSKMTLDVLWSEIKKRPYRIKAYYCDAAGTQTREQSGVSNIDWFSKPPRNIRMQYRRTAISYGIPIVRSYIRNSLGQPRLFVSEQCKNTIDEFKNYKYPEKDGEIVGENPVDANNDSMSSVRYFFVNLLDKRGSGEQFQEFNRFGSWSF